ncbi:MAG: magnesium transporter CorA family protein, partial [Clostridia bacterium]|nr:magnesium transporter CorA family protein [Clostridia bacterium]
VVMKTLTVLTLLVDTPAMIGSIWGMNTGVPWQGKLYGFWIVLGINIVVLIIMMILLWKKKMLK